MGEEEIGMAWTKLPPNHVDILEILVVLAGFEEEDLCIGVFS